jgi:hypothetical protein
MSTSTTAARFGYRAFGFFLASNLPVPGLKESPNPGLPEVLLDFGAFPDDFDESCYKHVWYTSRNKTESGEPAMVIYASGDYAAGERDLRYWLKYEEGTSVFVGTGAAHLWVTWPSRSSIEEACTFLLGPVMAVVAQFRGTTCLHGSAVVVDGGVIGFLGQRGAGKSTTATAFARAGFPVASDDLILLAETGDGIVVEPSYPVLRLWPWTVDLLFGDEDALPRISPQWQKRGLNLNHGDYAYQSEPLPLRALYILGERSAADAAPFFSEITGAAALLKLIANSWAHYADRPAILAAQLEVLARVSRQVPVRELIPHQDASRLSDLIQLITAETAALRNSARE